ncbi:Protein of unknown function [Gryllus bimaculatus]|nr:Protein of unknown function [Gryllus bimaculatus]
MNTGYAVGDAPSKEAHAHETRAACWLPVRCSSPPNPTPERLPPASRTALCPSPLASPSAPAAFVVAAGPQLAPRRQESPRRAVHPCGLPWDSTESAALHAKRRRNCHVRKAHRRPLKLQFSSDGPGRTG